MRRVAARRLLYPMCCMLVRFRRTGDLKGSGFNIAMKDLEIRGFIEQSGFINK
jgi:hypothetical protein